MTAAARRCGIAYLALALVWLYAGSPATAQSPIVEVRDSKEPITPIPAARALDPLRVQLGESLFGDRRLSHGNTHSCSSCHDIATNGASANVHDTPKGQPKGLNTPTVFNVSLNFRFNWEGNFRSLEEAAENALRNPAIMASSADEVAGKLRADPEAVRQFRDPAGQVCAAAWMRSRRMERTLSNASNSTAGLRANVMRLRRKSCPAIRFSNRSAASAAIRASVRRSLPAPRYFPSLSLRNRRCFEVSSLRNVAAARPIFTTAAQLPYRKPENRKQSGYPLDRVYSSFDKSQPSSPFSSR